jgi:Domain of unknown function (DUF6429)
MEFDKEKVDEITLALLYLTTFQDKHGLRAWKSHDWEVLDRLHESGYISAPATKAKSVMLTEEGAEASKTVKSTVRVGLPKQTTFAFIFRLREPQMKRCSPRSCSSLQLPKPEHFRKPYQLQSADHQKRPSRCLADSKPRRLDP